MITKCLLIERLKVKIKGTTRSLHVAHVDAQGIYKCARSSELLDFIFKKLIM